MGLHSWQELCSPDTGLSFCFKTENVNGIFINDLLDIHKNGFATVFHACLSHMVNLSLLMLNNTICGRTAAEVNELIRKFHVNIDDNEDNDDRFKQVIVVKRSNDDHNGIFNHQYRRIECNYNRNRLRIVTSNVNP